MKKILMIAVLCLFACSVHAQPPLSPQYPDFNFESIQMQAPRVRAAVSTYDNQMRKMFEDKGVKYPCKNIFIRSFKSENEFEVWAKNPGVDTFCLIKKYAVCALSGILGPKRWEGDRQVPEGYYFINEFNARSDYHLSLGLNYPNYSDMNFAITEMPGGDIYIHGGCLTIGCIPLTDSIIKQVYTMCLQSRIAGQMYIPVHIYPLRFTKKGLNFMGREYGKEVEKQKFWVNLKRNYDYFERTHKVPPVMYDSKGNYIF